MVAFPRLCYRLGMSPPFSALLLCCWLSPSPVWSDGGSPPTLAICTPLPPLPQIIIELCLHASLFWGSILGDAEAHAGGLLHDGAWWVLLAIP